MGRATLPRRRIGPRYGPLVMFAAATGLRPGEWLALEHRDIDHQARVVYVGGPKTAEVKLVDGNTRRVHECSESRG